MKQEKITVKKEKEIKLNTKLSYYTIIVHFKGGTFVHQRYAQNEVSALVHYFKSKDDFIVTLDQSNINIEKIINDSPPTLLKGLINVWCADISSTVFKKYMSINIIKTKRKI